MLEGLEVGRLRMLALAVAFVFAFGAAACGSDDDGGGGSEATAQEDGGGNPKRELEADYDAFIDDLYDGRWKEACAGFSAAFAAKYGKQAKPARSCEGTMKLEYSTIGVQPRPWVASVRLKSPTRAVGYTKTRADSEGIPIKFVKEDGMWRLDGTAEKLPAS